MARADVWDYESHIQLCFVQGSFESGNVWFTMVILCWFLKLCFHYEKHELKLKN